MDLETLSKKTNLSTAQIEDIIITDHVLERLTPKSKLKTLKVTLSPDNTAFIRKVAKQLKVDPNSVLVSAILSGIKAEELKREYKRFNDALGEENENKRKKATS